MDNSQPIRNPLVIALCLLTSALFALTGCSSEGGVKREPNVELTSQEAQAGSEETTPSHEPSIESSQLKLEEPLTQEFDEVLNRSCLEALAMGLEESSPALGVSYILVPEELSIEGYSAVEHDSRSDTVSLLWETDAFYTCYFSNQIALAEEFDASVPLSFEATVDGFSLFYDNLGETRTIEVMVTDGLVSGFDDGNAIWQVVYGVGEKHLALLERAVREFLD